MIQDITPVTALDWDSPGRRLYHVPFTLDNTWVCWPVGSSACPLP